MSQMSWFPFYHGDYLRDTMALSAEEHGIYLLLLMAFFSGGPLRDDIDELALIARTQKIESLRKILTRYWEQTDSGWTNRKMAEVRERQEGKQLARQEAGRKGGLSRASNARNLLEAKTKQCSSNAQASTRTRALLRNDEPSNACDLLGAVPGSSDVKTMVWDTGERLLGSRSMIGRLIKSHGEAAVFHAVAECANKSPADPRSYITALLREKKGAPKARKEVML